MCTGGKFGSTNLPAVASSRSKPPISGMGGGDEGRPPQQGLAADPCVLPPVLYARRPTGPAPLHPQVLLCLGQRPVWCPVRLPPRRRRGPGAPKAPGLPALARAPLCGPSRWEVHTGGRCRRRDAAAVGGRARTARRGSCVGPPAAQRRRGRFRWLQQWNAGRAPSGAARVGLCCYSSQHSAFAVQGVQALQSVGMGACLPPTVNATTLGHGRRRPPIDPRSPQVLAAGWLLTCYALQVPALQDLLLARAGGGAAWMLAWAGTPLAGPDPSAGELPLPSGGRGIEVLLRWKALLLAAAALWQRARRWVSAAHIRNPRAAARVSVGVPTVALKEQDHEEERGWQGPPKLQPPACRHLIALVNIGQAPSGCLTLLAMHSPLRWEQRLPPEVLAAAPPGDACPLFWPPPGAAGVAGGAAGAHPLAAGAGRVAQQLKRTLRRVSGSPLPVGFGRSRPCTVRMLPLGAATHGAVILNAPGSLHCSPAPGRRPN
jgi:hypothetical protein